MSLSEIKTAVDQGQIVHWRNEAYRVIKDARSEYHIAYMCGTKAENFIGLTHSDGVTLNGQESEFYLVD